MVTDLLTALSEPTKEIALMSGCWQMNLTAVNKVKTIMINIIILSKYGLLVRQTFLQKASFWRKWVGLLMHGILDNPFLSKIIIMK